MADVLEIGVAILFPPPSGPLRDINLVAVEEFPINVGWVFSIGHNACDIEPVAVHHIGNGKLLNEPFQA